MPALAATVLCLVVGITDGDTVKVRCGEGDQEKVRLTQIDTPERKQAFGTAAKEALSDLIFSKEIELRREGSDRWGRTLGAIYLDGVHINFELVRQGMAWCFRKYLTDDSCLDIEAAAKASGRGLWVDPEPVPPWEFRNRK